MKKIAPTNASAKASDVSICALLTSCASRPAAIIDDHVSARMPSDSVSYSTIMPRTTGMRRADPAITPESSSERWTIVPSGERTATAMCRGPRIITPSMTAWPP
jgi:hypothetical protein